ncbi:MAG TPA: hypothetical protein VFX93_14230, partial [Xanthomonadaceae bacterium]|nr:hypothetical protein [Xanthomonadaceae bacterium]
MLAGPERTLFRSPSIRKPLDCRLWSAGEDRMVRKLGITGMDSTTEADLRAAFQQARSALGDRWELTGEAEADAVIVDMDSMYGPMSWIRLHAAGKQVVGLTSSPRTQADHRLERPFNGRTLGRL